MMQVETLHIPSVELSGVTLIEASAGTGKTYTLAALYIRLLLERALTVDQILVVTYTRAATAELRVRIRGRIAQTLEALTHASAANDPLLEDLRARAHAQGDAHVKRLCGVLEQALAEFDRAAIYTIHGFCQRVLQRYAFESGAAFDAELSEDQNLLLEEVVSDFWASRLASADEGFVRALAQRGLSIESLLRFVQRVLPNPSLRLLPEPAPADVAEATGAFLTARDRVAQLWAASRGVLIELLLGAGLHGRIFAERKLVGEYAPALDASARWTPDALPKWLEHLTPDGLRNACNKGKSPPSHAFFRACEELRHAAERCSAARDAQIHAFMRELLEYARAELQRRAEARGVMGFEDLLMRLFDALQSERGPRLVEVVQNTYQAALIDEFQDTDPVQLEVFRRIYAERTDRSVPRTLFLIGDPKQAIYAFRGADIFAYLAAAQHTIDRVRTLEVNYRSDPELLAGVAQIFRRARLPFVFEEISFREVGAPAGAEAGMEGPALQFLLLERRADQQDKLLSRADAQAELSARIAAEIAQLLSGETLVKGAPVQPGQIAVLCRTNAQARDVQSALRQLGVPAVLDGDASVFDSVMAEELGRWLWAMAEPGDSARIRAALATLGLGLCADDLIALEQDEAAWDNWLALFHELQHVWQSRGFLSALHALCEQRAVAERLLVLPDGERRYTDLWHLAELLHEEEQRTRKGPRALLDFYRRVREGSAQREGMALEDVQVRLESDSHAVTLTTIHKSKGLEYPIVYCPYLWAPAALSQDDGKVPLFHDRQAEDEATLVLPGMTAEPARALGKSAAEREALAEATRLLYVALTRAKHRLYVVWGAIKGIETSALSFVLHQATREGDVDALRSAVKTELSKPTDAQLRAVLQQLEAAAPAAIGVRALCAAAGAPRYDRKLRQAQRLQARIAKFPSYPQARVGSFSALIERERWQAAVEVEPLDRDALAQPALALSAEHVLALPRVALAELPAGASFGHLIHGIYEHADFQVASPSELRAVVAQSIGDFAGDASWEPQLTAAIYDSLQAPLSAAGGALPSLSVVPRDKRLNELEFVFPVAEAATEAHSGAALSPRRLGQLLAAHARDADELAYAQQLGGLRFSPLRGFLRGFIDLALEHEGRYYILDYKSNRLGETALDYQPARLLLEMRRHHYVLQYLLYCVAVHRYLRLRLPGYSYDEHFGGVYYLFIRGMSTAHPPGTGVLYERPPRALIEELSRCLEQPEAQA